VPLQAFVASALVAVAAVVVGFAVIKVVVEVAFAVVIVGIYINLAVTVAEGDMMLAVAGGLKKKCLPYYLI